MGNGRHFVTTEKVIIKVDDSGRVEIEASGFSGDNCMKATAPMERALGKSASMKRKPEFFNQASEQSKEFE